MTIICYHLYEGTEICSLHLACLCSRTRAASGTVTTICLLGPRACFSATCDLVIGLHVTASVSLAYDHLAQYKSVSTCSRCHLLLHPALLCTDTAPCKHCLLPLHQLDPCRAATCCHSLLLPLHPLTTAFQRPRCLIILRPCKRGAHAHQHLVHLLLSDIYLSCLLTRSRDACLPETKRNM